MGWHVPDGRRRSRPLQCTQGETQEEKGKDEEEGEERELGPAAPLWRFVHQELYTLVVWKEDALAVLSAYLAVDFIFTVDGYSIDQLT